MSIGNAWSLGIFALVQKGSNRKAKFSQLSCQSDTLYRLSRVIDSREAPPPQAPDVEPQPLLISTPAGLHFLSRYSGTEEKRFGKMNEEYDVIVLGTGLTVRQNQMMRSAA